LPVKKATVSDPEIDLADRNLGRFALLNWSFNPPVDRLAARA